MTGNMQTFAPLCLLLCWILPVDSTKISFVFSLAKANHGIKLSMVEDAVDDMYFGCNKNMTTEIKNKYFEKENTGIFADAWEKSQLCAKEKEQYRDREDKALTKDHLQAICAYTSSHPQIYEIFNAAVRTNRALYGKSFPFQTLHFWLTSAVQILNNNKKCHVTYRRTKSAFTGNVNQIIRFGFFASSSYNTTLHHFGVKTCFKITTCAGAYLKKYPRLQDKEQEVLIPPYEMFKITQKKKGFRVKGLSDCEVVYILESTGVHSKLNCKAAYL